MTAFRHQPVTAAHDGDTPPPHGDIPTPADFKAASQSLLRSFFSLLEMLLGLLRRHVLLVLALILLGAALAWVYRLLVAPRYEYSTLLQCNGSSRTAYTQVFERLNSTVYGGRGNQLAALTGLEPASAEKIVSIKTAFPEPLPNDNDSNIVSLHRMQVTLRTTERPLHAKTGPLLVTFVNAQPFLQAAKQTEVAAVKGELAFIETQLRSIDSLHRAFNAALAQGAVAPTKSNGVDAASTYEHALGLQKEKGRLEGWLSQQSDPVTVVVPFYLSKAPMRLLWWVLLGALAGLLLALLIAVLRWLKKWSVPA